MSKKKQARKKATRKKKTKQGRSSSAAVQPLPSLQSMESLLAGLGGMGRSKRSAVDEAQEIMYAAWKASTREPAVALAERALTISADCADAYNLLAEEKAESIEESIDLYRKGVEAAERALGKQAFKEDVGYFWGLLETRPYVRSRAGLAQSLWTAARYQIPVTFVIAKHASYRQVKIMRKLILGKGAFNQKHIGMDIDEPVIDFCQLAQSMGVQGEKVERPDELTNAFRSAVESDRPRLIEVLVENLP